MKKINELPGYENIKDGYFITREGKVLSYCNKTTKSMRSEPIELKLKVTQRGYYEVTLMTKDNKYKYPRVHRLVALAFIPNPDNKTQVNHKDENKLNNHVDNLEWNTAKENSRYSNAKKVYMYDLEGNLLKVYDCVEDTKNDGYNKGHVACVCRGEEKHHKQRIFSYVELTKTEIVQRLSKPYYLKGDNRRK